MKNKALLLSIFCIICLFLSGCGKVEKETSANIELDGNPTTGYEWTCTSGDEDIVTITSAYKSSDPDVVGAGGTYTITLTGLKAGTVTVTCDYKRAWEVNDNDEEKVYEVTVDKNLKVTYIEK